MKKIFDEDDDDFQNFDKAKIIVSVIPVVLIILILAVMLIVNNRKKTDRNTDDVQQSILDYADEGNQSEGLESNSVQTGSDAVENDKQEVQTEETPSPLPKATLSPTPYKEVMKQTTVDYSKIKFDKDEQLKEMMTYWEDSNQKALDDLANLDRFKAMSWKLKGTKECYYYGEVNASGQADGTGIAVYADNQYYYGSWKNGERSGTGTFIHYHFHDTANTTDVYTYHQYTGSWANDLPDGEGSEHYDFDKDLLKDDQRYTSNRIGSYSAGLVHGEFYLTTIEAGKEDMMEWEAQAEHGSWIYRLDKKDGKGNRPVFVDYNDPNDFFWMLPKDNVNIGVPCLISKNKN